MRITTTMIDANTDTHLWSENFDRDFGDIFAIQDEIAGEVVDRLEMQISGELILSDRVDPESYALFLQARHLLTRQNRDATAEADRLVGEALAIDPENIAAWLLYVGIDSSKEYWGLMTREDHIEHTRDAMKPGTQARSFQPSGAISFGTTRTKSAAHMAG